MKTSNKSIKPSEEKEPIAINKMSSSVIDFKNVFKNYGAQMIPEGVEHLMNSSDDDS